MEKTGIDKGSRTVNRYTAILPGVASVQSRKRRNNSKRKRKEAYYPFSPVLPCTPRKEGKCPRQGAQEEKNGVRNLLSGRSVRGGIDSDNLKPPYKDAPQGLRRKLHIET